MLITCAHCGKQSDKPAGQVTRAKDAGLNLYCNRLCSGLGRRKGKTKEQKIAEKAIYDAEYRIKNLEKRSAQKAAYHQRNYNPDKQREYNQTRMAHHVEYCRRPEYREYKRQYDKEYRAKAEYGEFWESFLLMMEIHEEATRIAGGKYELLLDKGYFDRSTTKRRRDYERSNREELEVGALGNLELRERR